MENVIKAAAPLIELAIAEDIGPGDATSEAVLPVGLELHGRIVAKSAGVIAGLPLAEAVFSRVDPALRFISHVQDGAQVGPGDLVAEVTGPGRGMLAAERADRTQLFAAAFGHRHAHARFRGRGRRKRRGYPGHPQDPSRLPRAGKVRRAHGRRAEPSHESARYDDGQG